MDDSGNFGKDRSGCCPAGIPASGGILNDGGENSCCAPGTRAWGKGKALVSVIIIVAALGVGAHSLVRSTSAQSEKSSALRSFSEGLQERTLVVQAGPWNPGPFQKSERISFRQGLDSLKALDTLGADKDVVFILLPGESRERSDVVTKQVEVALDKLSAAGQKIGAYTLNRGAPDHGNLERHFAIRSLPCVVVLGRNGST